MRKTPLLLSAVLISAVSHAKEPGWTHYGGGPGGMKYSEADQITPKNVKKLKVAWKLRTGDLGEGFVGRERMASESTPILIGRTLYVTSPLGVVVAADAATGEIKWRFDPEIKKDQYYGETTNRGVSSWIDTAADKNAPCRHRIFHGTLEGFIYALDGVTGKPCDGFGMSGRVDMKEGINNRDPGQYTITSPPVIFRDLVITGSAIGDNRAADQELGLVRALDARTGEVRWTWDPLPRDPSDPNHDQWDPEQAARTGSANAWPPLSLDEKRDMVFVPTGSASPDFYGGERLGNNLYANSLVALRASTGEMIWYQQLVHHDLWDYDLPAQPLLTDLMRGGEMIPAVIQVTKMGLVFTFNRITGEPIFEIEERPVPQTDVPGEVTSPTQPFPVAPPPLVDIKPLTADKAWGFTFWDKGKCKEKIAALRSDGIYTPPSLQGTVFWPSYAGGANWGGMAFDPERQIGIVNVNQFPAMVTLAPITELKRRYKREFEGFELAGQQGTPYGMARNLLMSPFGAPCSKPPWGKLVAVDMSAGRILWDKKLGNTRKIAPISLGLGVPNIGGGVITKSGLFFISATTDGYFRAFDVKTGKMLWRKSLPTGAPASPMTYMLDGKQYVVISAGGRPSTGSEIKDYVVAYTLGGR